MFKNRKSDLAAVATWVGPTAGRMPSAAPAPSNMPKSDVKPTMANGMVGDTRLYLVDPTKLDVDDTIPNRFDMGDIRALATSIHEELKLNASRGGLRQPLEIIRKDGTPDRFVVLGGHRRREALLMLLADGVVFPNGVAAQLLDKVMSRTEQLLLRVTSNGQKPFLPLEEAALFKLLQDEGMSMDAIGKRVGRGDAYVFNTLALLTADATVTDALKDGTLPATLAKDIAVQAKGDAALQKELVETVRKAGTDKKNVGKAKQAVRARVREVREEKAAKAGRKLMPQRLTDVQVNEIGAKVAKQLARLLGDAKVKDGEALLAIIAKEDALAAAYTLGALHGLRVATGEKINLTV